MFIIKKKHSLSPLSISLLVHSAIFLTLCLYPPTKSFIFFKKSIKAIPKTYEAKDKILDEISIVSIKSLQNPKDTVELLEDHTSAISPIDESSFHKDMSSYLQETLDLELPIISAETVQMPTLEKTDQNYLTYLSPLTQAFPIELLDDDMPQQTYFEPKTTPLTYQSSSLPDLSNLDDLPFAQVTKPLPEMLDTDLYTYQDSHDDNYFKMELRLKDHKLFEEEPQEFLFVLDMTSKDAKKTLGLYTEAIIKSVKLLKPKDRFNVMFISKNLTSLFDTPQLCKKHALEKLEHLTSKTFKPDGKLKDCLRHLEVILDKTEESDLHTHCFLFTQDTTQDKDTFSPLSRFAHSKLSLYPVIYSESKLKSQNLHSLAKSLSGKIISPPTKASFNRKFSSFILDIKKTRLKNVSIKLTSDQENLDVSLSEETKQLTLKKPLKIFGKLKSTKNLKLHVVGSHGDDLFETSKVFPIHEAKKGSSLIKEELEKLN